MLAPGTHLGPYAVVAPLGAGAMGEVYRARDTRLGRDVAIKVLPAAVADDPERRARFEREARAIAALDHPHICGIHDVGEAGGTHYLVMPLLDGQTLAARLEKGALPLDQALTIAGQIADALDKAHRQGIVHRDLKPANVMLTKASGGSPGSPHAKLLDFGLAKLRAPGGPVMLSGSQTAETAATGTAEGTILGTLHYMAPEQVEGKEADARSDIWALGAVIYEMVAGAKPFRGDTAASVIGSILKDQPPSLSARQPLTPAGLDRLVTTCLEKDPEDRFQNARDLGRNLQWSSNQPAPRNDAGSAPARGMSAAAVLGVASVAAALASGAMWFTRHRPVGTMSSPLARFLVYPEPGSVFSLSPGTVAAPQVAVSPDGSHLAFVATHEGRPMLWLRALDAFESRPLPGSEHAINPFWSPDSKSVGFVSLGALKTVTVSGGPPVIRAAISRDARGASWIGSGDIIAAPTASGFLSISPKGTSVPFMPVNRAARDVNYRWPWMLSDGQHFIYTIRSGDPARRGIALASLGENSGTRLVDTDWSGAVVNDYLLYVRGRSLVAQPLDLDRRRLADEPSLLVNNIGASSAGYAAFGVSTTGVLAYAQPLANEGDILWFSRDGRQVGSSVAPLASYVDLKLSPDGRRLAVSKIDPERNTPDIWTVELATGLTQRITSDRATDANPQWSSDGNRIVYRSSRGDGANRLYQRVVGATNDEEVVLSEAGDQPNLLLMDYSQDQRYLVLTDTGQSTSFDVRVADLGDGFRVRPAVQTEFDEYHGSLSPDGRWLAYVSNQTGVSQVFVQSFPEAQQRFQVSLQGGSEPQWRADGRELFFVGSDGTLMAVPVMPRTNLALGPSERLFRTRMPVRDDPYRRQYAVSRDGQQFLVITAPERVPPPAIHVVLDWRSLLTGKQ